MAPLLVCAMSGLVDLTDREFDRLTVLRYLGGSKWECQCKCGKIKSVHRAKLLGLETRSCGCLRKETTAANAKLRKTHGHCTGGKNSTEYNIWRNMIKRCTNLKDKDYPNYGGRGIKICKRWLNSFADFLTDVGLRPSKAHTLDRKNNNGPYSPYNVCWATPIIQDRHKRSNRNITHNGKTMCVAAWADLLNVSCKALYCRLNYGWSVERTLTTPVRNRKPNGSN